MKPEIKKYREFLVKQQTLKSVLDERLSLAQGDLANAREYDAVLSKAQTIVNTVTILTLEEIKRFIQDSVTLCLNIVYGDKYRFVLDYDVKRGRSEANTFIQKNGEKMDPRDECGGGVIDVASIGLRLTLWVLAQPRTAAMFWMDEPFRFVSKDLTPKITEMLQEVVATFGTQIILVSHNDELIDGCDKTLRIVHDGQKSSVVEIT